MLRAGTSYLDPRQIWFDEVIIPPDAAVCWYAVGMAADYRVRPYVCHGGR